MTWARKSFYLSSSLVLAGAMSFAQNTPGAMPPGMGGSMPGQDNATSEQSTGATLRGCLSGSSDNYTLTDHSGAIYHLVGGGSDLQNSVGHEVEVTGAPDARRTGVPDSTAANTASSYQVAAVRDIASSCDRGGVSSGATGSSKRDRDPQPMNEMPPTTDSHPKGSTGEALPPHDNEPPRPQLMAMLQDPASQNPGNSTTQNSTTPTPAPGASVSTPASDMSQPPQSASPAQQTPSAADNPSAPPPVTDQTPAASQSPTSPNSQLGTSSANPTATPANPTAASPTAPDGTQPSAAQPSPSSAPVTPGAGSPQAATPQSTQDDANKPLYARPATDVPWARHPSSTATTTTTPQGSTTTTTPEGSTTTTTTPHQ